MTPPIQLQRLPRRRKPALKKRAFFMVALVLAALLLLALTGCSQAGAQQPQPMPTAQEQRIARGAARACEGKTPVLLDSTYSCLKEIP